MVTVTSSPVPTPPHHNTPVTTRHPPTYQPSKPYPTSGLVSSGATTVPPQARVPQPQVVSPEIINSANGGQLPTGYQHHPSASYQGVSYKPPQPKRGYDAMNDPNQTKQTQPVQWTNNVSRTPSRPPTSVPVVGVAPSHHNSPQGVYPGSSPTMQPENKRTRIHGPEATPTTNSASPSHYGPNSPYQNQSPYHNNYPGVTSSQSPAASSPARTDQPAPTAPSSGANQMIDALPLLKRYGQVLELYIRKWEPVEQQLEDGDKVGHRVFSFLVLHIFIVRPFHVM